MKVILTGANGFVGKNLNEYFKFHGLLSNSLSLRNPNWQEVFDNQGDAIIHLAGKAHDTTNVSNPDEYFKVNTNLTIELFDFFIKSEIKDFFYFSSVKAVADSLDGILDEDYIGQPQTPYGKSKLAAENYLLSKKLPLGKRLFIIRPCMIHGPGNKGNLNLLYKVVEKGLPWPLASFVNKRSFLSIDNLSYLVLSILKNSTIESGIYNFADDYALSTNEVVEIISKSIGKKPYFIHISPDLIKNLVKIGDYLPLPLNSERLKKLTESYVVSNSKIKKAIGVEVLPISSQDGLFNTISSFKTC